MRNIHYNIEDITELKIWDILEESSVIYNIEDIPNVDFTTIGLLSKSPSYGVAGVKLFAGYSDPDTHEGDCIRKLFFYYKNHETKGTGLEIHFEWYLREEVQELDENGEVITEMIDDVEVPKMTDVGIRKIEFKPLSIVEFSKIEVGNRDRTITYLQASSIGTPIEFYVGEIFTHYQNFPLTETDILNPAQKYINIQGDLITKYIKNGGWDFEWAIENETHPGINAYLDIIIEAPSDEYPSGKSVKDSILQQIKPT